MDAIIFGTAGMVHSLLHSFGLVNREICASKICMSITISSLGMDRDNHVFIREFG